MANWKVLPDMEQETMYVSLLNSQKFFAVDDSGSTGGAILRKEKEFVDHVHGVYSNENDSIALWGSDCDNPTTNFNLVRWSSDHGGTCPTTILENGQSLNAINNSNVWFLITDGEVWDRDVHRLAELAQEKEVLSVPIIFLIVGYRGITPETTNISVGISFFAGSRDTLILFKDVTDGKIYVIAGKGCFTPVVALDNDEGELNLKSWDNRPIYENETAFFKACALLDIEVPTAESRAKLPNGVSLGPEFDEAQGGPTFVDVNILLQADYLSDDEIATLFAEEAFNNLAVAYKIRNRIPELRAFVQKQKTEQFTPKLDDVAGAAAIIEKMNATTTKADRKVLQEQLREAHVKNRELYQKTVAGFANSAKERSLKQRNQLVNSALQILASIEATGFNAEILSRRSNRARRAEVVSTEVVTMDNLDLSGPSFKSFCSVCCDEEVVMSISLKALDSMDDNTTDFALNFPLAAGSSEKNINVVSSQNICYQCAISMPSGRSIYQEDLNAVIPTVHYAGSNKKFINNQLYSALTTGLATGTAGIGQLFTAIMHGVLNKKSWAGAENAQAQPDDEILVRQFTFQWMLDQMVENTWARENFAETGDWVPLPVALKWVAKDFDTNNMESFAVTYPAAGFETLLFLGKKVNAFSEKTVHRLNISKAVYSIVSVYLSESQAAVLGRPVETNWQHKYLATIYAEFNSDLIPRDLRGPKSLIRDVDVFLARLSTWYERSQTQLFAWASAEDKKLLMGKIQIVLFWLMIEKFYRETGKAKDFFQRVGLKEHLHSAVLVPDLSVPESEAKTILLSIFATRSDNHLIDFHAAHIHTTMIPFETPFGASVLHCGAEACKKPFYTGDPALSVKRLEAIRAARAKHLIQAFGIQNRFENTDTGLPERNEGGKSPSSIHINLHSNLVLTWAALSRDGRRAVVADVDGEREKFAVGVRKRLCEQGRGNVYDGNVDQYVRAVLPSFFAVLAEALRLQGKSGEDVAVYDHDFEQNKMVEKIGYELKAKELRI